MLSIGLESTRYRVCTLHITSVEGHLARPIADTPVRKPCDSWILLYTSRVMNTLPAATPLVVGLGLKRQESGKDSLRGKLLFLGLPRDGGQCSPTSGDNRYLLVKKVTFCLTFGCTGITAPSLLCSLLLMRITNLRSYARLCRHISILDIATMRRVAIQPGIEARSCSQNHIPCDH